MTYKAILLLTTLLVILTSIPLAQGTYAINGINIAQVQIGGRLFCSATGNTVPGTSSPGIAGINVALDCFGGRTNLAQAVTNTSGFFVVVYNTIDSILFDPSLCFITIKLPVASCTLLAPTGNLRALPSLVNVIQTALGPVAVFVIGFFQNVLG